MLSDTGVRQVEWGHMLDRRWGTAGCSLVWDPCSSCNLGVFGSLMAMAHITPLLITHNIIGFKCHGNSHYGTSLLLLRK